MKDPRTNVRCDLLRLDPVLDVVHAEVGIRRQPARVRLDRCSSVAVRLIPRPRRRDAAEKEPSQPLDLDAQGRIRAHLRADRARVTGRRGCPPSRVVSVAQSGLGIDIALVGRTGKHSGPRARCYWCERAGRCSIPTGAGGRRAPAAALLARTRGHQGRHSADQGGAAHPPQELPTGDVIGPCPHIYHCMILPLWRIVRTIWSSSGGTPRTCTQRDHRLARRAALI